LVLLLGPVSPGFVAKTTDDLIKRVDVEELRFNEASPAIIPSYSAGSSVVRRSSIIDLGLITSRPMSRLDGLMQRTSGRIPSAV
jgi:hypothetical protein